MTDSLNPTEHINDAFPEPGQLTDTHAHPDTSLPSPGLPLLSGKMKLDNYTGGLMSAAQATQAQSIAMRVRRDR